MAETTQNLRLSDSQVDDLRKQVEDHRREALNQRGDWPDRHAERMKRYLADPSLRPPGPWPDAPRLFIPRTREVLEKLQSEIWNVLFGLIENIRLEPFGEDDVENAEAANRLLRWFLTTLPAQDWWFSTSFDLIFDALLDSGGVGKVTAWTPPWAQPQATRGVFDKIVRIDPVDLGMFLTPSDATGLQYPEARFVGQEFHLTADDLLRMRRQGYETPDPDEVSPSSPQPSDRQREEIEREGLTAEPWRKDTYRFVEMYERFRVDSRSRFEEDVIVSYFPDAQETAGTRSSRGRLSRIRRLIEVYPQDDRPRRPYFEVTVFPQPRQWRGQNIPDRLDSMQDMINRLHEQLLNYGDISMLPYVFVNTFLTGELPDLRQVRPGSTVAVEDTAGVQFAPRASLNRHFAEQISMADANIERDSSVTDFSQGRSPDRPNVPRTASATLALLQESRKAFGAMARHAAIQFQRMLTFYFRTWQSVLPSDFDAPVLQARALPEGRQDILMRLFGDISGRFVASRVSKERLSGIFDAKLEINPEAAFDRQILLQLAQLVVPAIGQYPLGQRELFKRVWEAFNQKGFEQIWPEDIARTQTQIVMLTQQVQLAALQQQIGAGVAAQEQAQQQQTLQQSAAAALQNGQQDVDVQTILEALQGSGEG